MNVDLIFRRVQDQMPFRISREDIISLLETAAREIPLYFVTTAEMDRQTALVNYRPRTKEAELTKLGRALIELAESKSDWLSADIDALKIKRAIKVGRFDNAYNYCLMLESIVQEELFKLQDIKEEPLYQKPKARLIDYV